MAERRMFSCKITSSDAFKMMSLAAQALYFQLGMEADDDGFVNNAVSIARSIGASTEHIEEIIENRFAIRLNKKLLVIKHWKINNYIQKDRYHETAYKQYKDQLIIKDNDSYTEKDKTDTRWSADGYDLDTTCIQGVSKMDTEVRIGKDRLNITSLSNDSLVGEHCECPPVGNGENTDLFGDKVEAERGRIPVQKIVDYWNNAVKSTALPQIKKLNENRKSLIRQRWMEYKDDVYVAIDKTVASDFLTGRDGKWQMCDFDWVFKKDKMVKILEGKYDEKNIKVSSKYANNGKTFRPHDINGQYDDEELEVITEL